MNKKTKDMEILLNFINNLPKNIEEELPYSPIQILKNTSRISDSIADGKVYKINIEGDIISDGYEKFLLLLLKGSMIKKHRSLYDKNYKRLKGVMSFSGDVSDNNSIKAGDCYQIDRTVEDTVILTYKK